MPALPLLLAALAAASEPSAPPGQKAAPPPAIRFEEISEAAGLGHLVHTTRSFGDRPKAEVLEMFTDGGAAVAVGDFDGDGWDDLFLTESDEGRPNHLLRNVTGEREGDGGGPRFEEVTEAAGVGGGNDASSIVADALWVDYDDDGRLDLLVARFGTPLLYRNLGASEEGAVPRFEEVSEAAGLTAHANTIAVIAFDYDGDGWLDLLFGNYFPDDDLLDLDHPNVLPEDLDNAHNGGGLTLWRNVPAEGEGAAATGGRAFVDVTEAAGLAGHTGWSLDVGHGDLDNDGDQDVYVAGDYGTDRLFINRGPDAEGATFEDVTEERLGFDTKKGMNVDMADYDGNGYLDVYVTNITDEYMRECNMLWANFGPDGFLDLSRETGTCDTDWGWGAKFGDFDNDGWIDLFAVAGLRSAGEENYIPVLLETLITPGVDFSDLHSYPDIGDMTWSGYQPQRLFRNLGDGTFQEMAAEAGIDNLLDGRGVGIGDFDRDGQLDLVQTNARERPLLHRNVTDSPGHWLGVRLRGAGVRSGGSNRQGIGARVTVTAAGGRRWIDEVDGGNGYAGQSITDLHFGLGEAARIESIEVRWPSGRVERLEAEEGRAVVPLDTLVTIEEGKGIVEDAPDSPTREERLWQHRNLGKALYENPATQYDAVDELRTALELAPDSVRERVNFGLALLRAGREAEGVAELERAQEQDPSVPHTWFNLGIAYKRASEYERAIRQLEGMLERVPDEAKTHYNLGVLHKLEADAETSLHHFERAAELDPGLAGPHFQLAAAYRQAGRADDAARAMATFREIKQRQAGAAVEEDLEWSWYSELYDIPSSRARPAPTVEIRFEVREVAPGASDGDGGAAGLEVLQADGEPAPDLLAWGPAGVRLLSAGRERVERAGLGGLAGVRHAAAGDLDGDGRADLAVVTGDGLRILVNRAGADGPAFEPLPPEALPEAAKRVFDRALWVDVDHDYDPDLLLFGAAPALLRNDGDGTFTDRTEHFPFGEGAASDAPVTAAAVFDLVADSQGFDVAVAHADGTGTLYRDLLGGVYEAEPLDGLPAGTRELIAADLDHDGWTDLLAVGDGGVVALHNVQDLRSGGLRAVPISDWPTGAAAIFDLDNRGAGDLVLTGPGAGPESGPPALLVERGGLRFDEAALPETGAAALRGAAGLAAADFDGDGRAELVAVAADGTVHLLTHVTETPHGHLRIALEGVKNPKLAAGSEVEVKAGSLYQKKLYQGVPLTFGLADRETADAVRITWPNGLIQNEVRVPSGTSARYEEAPRLSGSCPMIFTWNGEEFEFITDVLGVAPLGASAGDGEYFPVDHDEVIQIAGESLVPRTVDGEAVYEVRITEELREVAFLDRVRLLAVDRPPGLDLFVSDKFVGPPFPTFRLYGVEERRYPVAARDHRGNDVLARVSARDESYVDGFARDASGLAELHHLELAFDRPVAGDGEQGGEAILVLHGWVDWADGSTFLASSQGDGPFGSPLVLPYLQAKDASGRWVTVVEDMGLPAGKPKTIVVDLTGKLPPETTELRIVTSACVYWDEIFLGSSNRDPLVEASGGATARLAEVPALGADLSFRGFSRPVVHPERKQPERFVYADRLPITQWNQTSGLYTRFGAVGELLATVDDRFVVMGSGDEVRLRFNAAALDPPPDGWRRDFLLAVDGWAKDGDANTAHSQTVGPLPFRGMPQYPYEPPHAYPDDTEHRRYLEEWLTRPAIRVHQPLRPPPVEPALAEPASATGER